RMARQRESLASAPHERGAGVSWARAARKNDLAFGLSTTFRQRLCSVDSPPAEQPRGSPWRRYPGALRWQQFPPRAVNHLLLRETSAHSHPSTDGTARFHRRRRPRAAEKSSDSARAGQAVRFLQTGRIIDYRLPSMESSTGTLLRVA